MEGQIPSYSFHVSSVLVRHDCVQFPERFPHQYSADQPLHLPSAYAWLKKVTGGSQA